MSDNYDEPVEPFSFLNRLIPRTHPAKRTNPQNREYGSDLNFEMKRAYNTLSEHTMSLKDELMKSGEYRTFEEMLSGQTPERRDIFERGESFKQRFSFDNLMKLDEINLTEREVKWLNDFEINVRYEFLTYIEKTGDVFIKDNIRIWETTAPLFSRTFR